MSSTFQKYVWYDPCENQVERVAFYLVARWDSEDAAELNLNCNRKSEETRLHRYTHINDRKNWVTQQIRKDRRKWSKS